MNIDLIRKMDRIHPYPAKFTIDLAIEYILKYSKENDLIYDPFLGSGTTLLATKLLGRNGIGTDINHIAILISKFKLLNLTSKNFNNLNTFINNFNTYYPKDIDTVALYNYPSIEHWFCQDSIKILSLIKKNIETLKNEDEKIFCKLIMSSIINSISNQESDTRYAAINKPKINIDYAAALFTKKFLAALQLYQEFTNELTYNVLTSPQLLDSQKCTSIINKESVNLILTSPPYPNTYDYYLYHKHRMNWLGYDVKFSMHNEIGSRREFSSLKQPKEKFDIDMHNILAEANKLLKCGGYTVIVIGDGKIQGNIYNAKSNMVTICNKLNWKLIDYSFSQLDNTSRSFQKSFRTKEKKEHILVFRKVK